MRRPALQECPHHARMVPTTIPTVRTRRDERQRKQRCEQGRHTEEVARFTDGDLPEQEEPQPEQEEHVQRTSTRPASLSQEGEETTIGADLRKKEGKSKTSSRCEKVDER